MLIILKKGGEVKNAARALEWTQKRRIAVPRDLSIISLESDPSFYPLGLTRCEPDRESIGYCMAHAIIGDFPVKKTHAGFIKTTANVIEKLTTK